MGYSQGERFFMSIQWHWRRTRAISLCLFFAIHESVELLTCAWRKRSSPFVWRHRGQRVVIALKIATQTDNLISLAVYTCIETAIQAAPTFVKDITTTAWQHIKACITARNDRIVSPLYQFHFLSVCTLNQSSQIFTLNSLFESKFTNSFANIV